MPLDTQKLQNRLGYQFADQAHLQLALTHRSARAENNERYEFLGDAVLGLVIAGDLFERFPDHREGKLTRMRSTLVRGDTLAKVADELSLQSCLILGSGELKAGGRKRASIRADALEAVLGAIYLDSDFETVRDVILRWFETRLESARPDIEKDPKTLLQETMQKRGLELPEYKIIHKTGHAHDLSFTVECRLTELGLTQTASDKSRRRAEQTAAKLILKQVNI